MVTKEEVDLLLNRYNSIMTEIKARIALIDRSLHGLFQATEGWVSAEFCYLQLRKICELIAFGCLVAHGDIEEVGAPLFQKEWNAQRIIEQLEKLHPEFYPQGRKFTVTPRGLRLGRTDREVLIKEELPKLYGIAGENLHRGSLRKLFRGEIKDVTPDIVGWTTKIIALLENHHISSPDNKRHILCDMGDDQRPVQSGMAISPS